MLLCVHKKTCSERRARLVYIQSLCGDAFHASSALRFGAFDTSRASNAFDKQASNGEQRPERF